MKRFLLSILFFVGFVSVGLGQSTGDFQTRQSGDWNNSATWEEWTGSSWDNTTNTPTSSNGVISILNTHTVTVTANVTVDQTFIRTGGEIYVNSGVLLTVAGGSGDDLTIENSALLSNSGNVFAQTIVNPRPPKVGLIRVRGTFANILPGAEVSGSSTSNFIFESGSEYRHEINGSLIPTASWNVSSTVRITGVTNSVPANLNQTFGNFVWDCVSQSSFLDFQGNLTTINGNFIMLNNSGFSGGVYLSQIPGFTLNIGGNLIIDNGSYFGFNADGISNINITGDLIIQGNSEVDLTFDGDVDFDIAGDFNISNSNINVAYGGAGVVSIFLDQDFSFSSSTVGFLSTNNGLIQFTGSSTQTVSGIVDFENFDFLVSSSSTLIIPDGAALRGVSGATNFTLNTGATLLLGSVSPSGVLQNSTSSGAIRVSGTRSFNTGSKIGFTGGSDQYFGNAFPASGVDVIINNTGAGVNMTSDFTLSAGRTLTLTNGTLNIGDGNLLTLNGTVSTTSGGISGGSLSNLTIGGTGAFGTLGFVGTNSLNNFTINRTSSGTVTLGNDLTVVGSLTQTAGNLILNGNELTVNGDYTQSGGSLVSDASSSITVNGAGSLPGSLAFSGDVQRITLDRASATLNTGASGFTAGTIELFSGALSGTGITIANTGTIERRENGSLTNGPTAAGTYNLIYNNSSAINSGPELTTNLANLTKQGAGILTALNDFTVNGDLTLSNGSFDFGSNTVSLNGDFVVDAGSTLTNATITFDGITSLSGSQTPTFGSITVNNTFNPTSSLNVNGDITNNGTLNSSAGTLTINAASQLGGSNPITVNNFTIGASGVVTASASQALEIDGNLTNNGSFAANGGTVIFGGNTTISGTVPNFANIQVEGIFNAPSTLNLSGGLINNGTFNDGNGIVNMTGGSARAIAGTSPFNIHTLNLDGSTVSNNNTGGVSIENGITLAANTIFDADGGGTGITTLLSTSSTDAAYVGQIPSTSSVTGNITVQRFFSTGRFWRYLGSPVTNATVADWQEEFPITGTFSDPSTGSFDGTTLNSSFPTLYFYNAGGSAYVAYPTSGTAASNPIENGRGYSPFIRNNISNIIGAVTGTLKQQSASMPVAYNGDPNESWNLVANPYAAPIDWDAGGWTKTNVLNEVHIPLVSSGSFATYIGGVSANGGSRYIASGQAFWVRTDAASPELTAVEAVKSVVENPTYFRTDPLEVFRIKMLHADLSDEIVFALRDEATFGYDEEFDANRRLNINGFGYTLSTTAQDGRKLKINSIPKVVDSDCSVAIPLNMESVSKTGDFTLSFSEVSNLLNYYKVDFIDNYTNEVIAVSADFQYSYKINSEAASKAVDRFSLLLNNSGVGSLINLKDVDACVSSEVSYPLENLNANYSYSVFSGEVKIAEISKQTETAFLIPDSLLQNTVNVFDVYGQAGTCDSAKVGTFTVSTTDSNINLDVKVIGSSICPDASEGSFNLNTESGVDYFILDDSDTIQNIRGDGNLFTGVIESKYLNPGNNAFLIYAEKNECAYGSLNQQLEIDVTDLEIDQTIVFNSKSTCLSSPADINFVSQDGVDYEIYKGTKLVKSITGEGNEETIQIAESSLTAGLNEFTVLARYGSCAEFEFPEPIQIEVEESINANLSLVTKNTCGNQKLAIIIKNAQADKVYTLQSAGENISSLTATADGVLEFDLNSEQLSIGVNELDIEIEGKACGAILSANQAIFTVNESINADLNIEAADVCIGGQISIEIANPQIGKTYNLIESGDVLATEVASSEDVLVFNFSSGQFGIGTHSLNVDIVDDICGTISANQTIEFEVFDAAIISAVENQNVCKSESVVIDLSANVPMSSYQLYVGEELISEVSSSAVTLSPEETTTYTLTGIAENGCDVNTVNFSVEVTDLAKPGILVSNNVLESSVEGESYQWYLNSEKLVNEQGKVLVAQESGDYTLEVSKANCTEMSDAYTFSEEVLNANRILAESLHLYPNPVQDVLYLELENLDELEVKIYTISGRFMDQMNLNSDKNQSIDMSKFAEGTYLIQLTSGKGSITKRIIKK